MSRKLRDRVAGHRRLLVAVVVLLTLLPLALGPSLLYVLSLVFIYAILAFSAIVPIGYAGQLVLAQGAFFGIGAYTFVKLTSTTPFPTWLAIVVATVLGAAIAFSLGLPAIRAGGIYLGIITLAFNEMFVIALDLFSDIFGGSKGLPSQDLNFFGLASVFPSELLYYYVALAAFLGALYTVDRLLESEVGWAFLALRENTTVAESIGINSRRYRLLAFTLVGAINGFAGSIFAPLVGYISPTMFNLHTTIDIILAGVAGGISLPAGSVLGAVIVVLLPEYLRFLSDVRFIVYGILLVLLLIYLPNGIGGWLKSEIEDRIE